MVRVERFELSTNGLKVRCSTDWATRAYWQEIKDSNSNLSGWSRVFYR